MTENNHAGVVERKAMVMKRWSFGLATALALALHCSAAAEPAKVNTANVSTAQVVFLNAEGKQVGQGTLKQTPSGVLIRAEVRDISTGEHAFHIHETGKCNPADKFKSAGGHYAPRGAKHGLEAAEGPHAGDMPNQFVGQDKTLNLNVLNTAVSLDDGEATLFDVDGSALVIHAKADDYQSQPSGAAGDRVACAVVKRRDATR